MRRAFKFRLDPTVNQERELCSCLETHRRLYNEALAQRKDAWEQEQRTVTHYEQRTFFTNRRNSQIEAERAGKPGPYWLAHIASSSLRTVLKRLDLAFQAFFRRIRAGEKPGYPRFRGRDRYDSFGFEDYAHGCTLRDRNGKKVAGDMPEDADLRGHRLDLFGVGRVRIRLHRPICGKIKTVTVKRQGGHWYAVFSCDLGDVAVTPSSNPPVGVDVGLTVFAATSEGEFYPNPRPLKGALGEVKRLGRKIALRDGKKKKTRQYPQKGSRRREKNKRRLRRLYERVANLRHDSHHKVSLDLVRRYGTIAVESLDIKQMQGNRRLARSIGDAAWGTFLNTLKTKAESAGVMVVEVDPRGTSQGCSGCGAIVPKDLTVRWHDCPHCGLSIDRDVNAARNILARGLAGTPPAGRNGEVAPCAPRSALTVSDSLSREMPSSDPATVAKKPPRSRKRKQPPAE